jgi:hypothetical protein
MEKWKLVMLEKDGFPVKVYVNHDDSRCIVFPLFGRYHGVNSDKSALDLCIQIMFHVCHEYEHPGGVTTFAQYESCKEDTQIIFQEAA